MLEFMRCSLYESKTIKIVLRTILYKNLLSPKIEQTKSKQTKYNYEIHLHIGPACTKVRKRRTAKLLLIKAKSFETLLKGR